MHRLLLLIAALSALVTPLPSYSQSAPAPDSGGFACKAKTGALALGAAGGLAGGAAANAGLRKLKVDKGVALAASLAVGALLTDKIACLLTDQEREQAANATQQAVDQGVGAKVDWKSSTRPNVGGSSSVNGEVTDPDGTVCRSVTDVVIVEGEETQVQKKLCRAPGAMGYKLAAS